MTIDDNVIAAANNLRPEPASTALSDATMSDTNPSTITGDITPITDTTVHLPPLTVAAPSGSTSASESTVVIAPPVPTETTTLTVMSKDAIIKLPPRLRPSGSERIMSGLKPRLILRKRGISFKETTKASALVDEKGARHLNQYTFLEELGHGAYGTVVRIQSNETKEYFAAKIVDKKALKKVRIGRFGNALQSVKKELAIWQKLKHRHIVALREVIDAEDCDELYMICELVEGGPVLDGETVCTPLSPEQTKLYFCQLIEGIDFLHENKIIHRDIKPGNLLLQQWNDEKILKISDFGVSHEMETDNDQLRQTAGTAVFMAPEMLTGEKFYGKPIDIWASGVTLYMFVYGHPPFVAKTMPELYAKILGDSIDFPSTAGEHELDPQLIDLLKKILEKDPQLRYTSQQIRAHPWAWTDFQVSSMRCITHPEGRRSSFSSVHPTMVNVAKVRKSLGKLFHRPSEALPEVSPRTLLNDAREERTSSTGDNDSATELPAVIGPNTVNNRK